LEDEVIGSAGNLTRLMKGQDRNAIELAKKVDIPASLIYSLIRKDSSRVDIKSLIKIARALDTITDYIYSSDNEPYRSYSYQQQEIAEIHEQLHKISGMRINFSLQKMQNRNT